MLRAQRKLYYTAGDGQDLSPLCARAGSVCCRRACGTADKGYHSNETMVGLDSADIRSYIAEPDRGRRDWSE
jgi:hypothetical protein